MRKATLVVSLMLVAVSVSAGTVTSLSPSSIRVRSGEYFMTAAGSGFDGGDTFVFDGPAGHFEVDVNSLNTTGVVGWVPLEIVNTSGTYSLVVRSASGDSAPVSFTVSKAGNLTLQLHLPEILVASALSKLGTPIRYEVSTTGGDPSTVTIKCTPESGSTFPFGTSSISCVASDRSGGGDEGRIAVSVTDTTAPEMKVPDSFEVPADNAEGAYVKYDVSAWDEIDGALRTTCLPESGTLLRPGRTTVNCEAVDLSLNPASGSFDVLVRPRDIGVLELKVPDGLTVVAEDKTGALVTYDVVAYGSADPDPVVQCSPESGSWFEVGSTKVFCTAWDDFDQRVEAAFVVDVVEKFALELPDVTAEATSPEGTEVSWDAKAKDWSSVIECTPSSGTLFGLGDTTVDCESKDARGRRAGGSFVVRVADTIAPHIEGVRATAGPFDGVRQVLPVDVSVDAIDAADAMPRCSVAGLTADEGEGSFDWRVTTDLHVDVAGARAQSPFRIQVACVDASGNRASTTVRVASPDTKRRPAR